MEQIPDWGAHNTLGIIIIVAMPLQEKAKLRSVHIHNDLNIKMQGFIYYYSV